MKNKKRNQLDPKSANAVSEGNVANQETEAKKKCLYFIDEAAPFPLSIVKIILLVIVTAILILFAMHKIGTEKQDTITFYDNEAMRTMDTPVTMAEFMLYTLDVKSSYDEAMDDDFYAKTGTNAEGETETYENIVKEEIAESIRMVKTLCAAAEPEFQIALSEDEENVLKDNADTYYEMLMKNGVDPDFLSQEVVRKYIREEYLSQKVYDYLGKQYQTENQTVVDVGNEQIGNEAETVESTAVSDELVAELARIVDEYDSGYSYKTNINWELMDSFKFYEPTTYTAEDIDNAVNALSHAEETEVTTEADLQ